MAEAAPFIGPILTAAGAVANEWYSSYRKEEEKIDNGNNRTKKKMLLWIV